MKYYFTLNVPEVKIEDRILFPGVKLDVGVEQDKEEFLAVLPHLQEMAKIIVPHLERMRVIAVGLVTDAALVIGPELLAMGKQAVDSHCRATETRSEQFTLDRELAREIKRATELEGWKTRGM